MKTKHYPCKDEITYEEYLQVHGLLVLAKENNRQLNCIVKGLEKILGTPDDENGHIPDVVFSDGSVDELLQKMVVKVIKP